MLKIVVVIDGSFKHEFTGDNLTAFNNVEGLLIINNSDNKNLAVFKTWLCWYKED
jgi:hypothetical protein